jgi:hypothetical protein
MLCSVKARSGSFRASTRHLITHVVMPYSSSAVIGTPRSQTPAPHLAGELIHAAGVIRQGRAPLRHRHRARHRRAAGEAEERQGKDQGEPHDRRSDTGTPRALARALIVLREGSCLPASRRVT